MRNAQTFQRMEMPPLRVGNVLFADGNASFAGGERAFYGWKRRCADVRAGTQAPPLRVLLERIVRGCPLLRFRLGRLHVDG